MRSAERAGEKMPTPAQQANATALAVAEQFGFADVKWTLVALAELAAQEMRRDAAFAARVRERYEELTPRRKSRALSAEPRLRKASAKQWPELVPIKQIPGFQPDVSRPLDPYFIVEYFGARQLQTALERQPPANLKQAIAIVQERNPGVRFKGRVTVARAVAFIVEQVLGQ